MGPIVTSPKTIFSLDLRSLAVCRVGLGFLVFLDACGRLTDLSVHYGDAGLLPRAILIEKFSSTYNWSLFLASGQPLWNALLLSVLGICGLLVAIGYRAKIFALLAWVLLISVQNRNPVILNAGDVLMRCSYFWMLFLPISARFSVDAALAKDRPDNEFPTSHLRLSIATIALIIQVGMIYLTTAIFKHGDQWWPDGTASYMALSLDQFTTYFGKWLLNFPEMLRIGTYYVYALEWAAFFMLLCPFFFVPIRILALVLLISMHLGFDASMHIGLFPWVDTFGLLCLLPSAFWDFWAKKLSQGPINQVELYYDKDCGFCRKSALLVHHFLLFGYGKIYPIQDHPDINKIFLKENKSTWIAKPHAEGEADHLFRFEGIWYVLGLNPVVGWLFRKLPYSMVSGIGNIKYRWIARNRSALSQWTKKFLPYRPAPKEQYSWWVQGLCGLFLIYVVWWNLMTLPDSAVTMNSYLKIVANVTRVDQKWNMFSPYPLKDDGWYIIPGKLKDGTEVDVYNLSEDKVSRARPAHISDTYKNARWRKYMMNIWQKKKKRYRLYFGKYLCRRWNNREGVTHQKKLETFEITFMLERFAMPPAQSEIEPRVIWKHNCFKQEKKK